jgi:predicted dehydrogenase
VLISRILIVGLGSIGSRHLRLIRGLMPKADIRVLRHQATDEVPEFSNGCFFHLEEAIAFSPEISIIANPATFHIPLAKALAQAGSHLFIEKPLSSSLNGISDLIEISRQRNVILFTGYNLRFLSSLRRYRELIVEGVIGRIFSVRCDVGQHLRTWRLNSDYRKSVSARKELGGGVLLELSHELDYLRWIFGDINWIKATLSKQSDLEIDVEDTAHLVLGITSGMDRRELMASVNLDFFRHDTTRLCIAIGEYGSLRWDGLAGQVSLYKEGEAEWRDLFSFSHQPDDSYIEELSCFIDCINKNTAPPISGDDGLAVMQIIEAARKSAQSEGCIIKVVKHQ